MLFGAVINFELLQPPDVRELDLEALVDLVLAGVPRPARGAKRR